MAVTGDEDAGCAPAYEREQRMRIRITQSLTLGDRLKKEARNLRKQAEGMPPSIRRDELLRKAEQTETAAHMNEWLASPGFRPPK